MVLLKEFNIYSIGKSFIKSKKAYSLFIGGIIVSSIVLILIISSMFNTLLFRIDEYNATKYGTHHAIVYNISDKEKEALSSSEELQSYGIINNLGFHESIESNVFFTIGYFDEQAIKLGNINVVKGELPKTKNEIAIEKHIAERMGNIDIGSTIRINNNDQVVSFTVTGILMDFSGTWNVPEEILRGKSDVPQAIVGDPQIFENQAESLLLKFDDFDEQEIFDIFAKYNLDEYFSIVNTKYYIIGQNDLFALKFFDGIFNFVLILIIQVIICYSCHQFTVEIRKSYKTLRILGFTYGKIFALYGIYFGSIILVALILGILIGMPVSIVLGAAQNVRTFNILFNGTFLRCLLSIFLNSLVVTMLFYNDVVKFCRSSLAKHSDQKNKTMKIKKNFISSLINYNFQQNIKKIYPILVAFSIILLLIGIVNIHFNGYYAYSNQKIPDFIMQPNSMEVYKEFGPYRLYKTRNIVFNTEDTETITSHKEIDLSYSEVSTNGAVIISNPINGYWNQWTTVFVPQNQDTINYPNAIPRNVIAANDYRILLSNPTLVELINEKYYNVLDTKVNMESTILFLPNYSDNNPKIENLQFAQLYFDENFRFEKVLENIDYVKCRTNEIAIDAQINDLLYLEKDSSELYSEKPTIIIPRSKIEGSTFFSGAKKVVVYLKDGLSDKEMKDFDSYFRSFTRGFPDSYFFSLFEINQRESQQSLVINLSLILISGILIFFLLIVFYHAMYLMFYKRRVSLGIYRSLGIDYQCMFKIIQNELKRYILICILFSFILLLVQNAFLGNTSLLLKGVCFLFITYIALTLVSYFAAKKLSKLFKDENIYELIRYKE